MHALNTLFSSFLLFSISGVLPSDHANLNPTPSAALSKTAEHQSFPAVETFEPEAQKELFLRLEEEASKKSKNLAEGSVPIFVITCDRISVLIKSLLSYYTHIRNPIEVIIHDNNTTYPPTQEFLRRLEKAGLRVVWSSRDVINDYSLSSISTTISDWFQDHESPFYVVTDPDIEIEEGADDILEVFAHLLRENPQINVVGPMLRRDDLPDHYPLKNLVQTQQQEVYARDPIYYALFKHKVLALQPGYIDTAFGMYRRDFQFHNYNRAIQTYEPYQARHLDWYIDQNNLTPDQVYYKNKNSPVGHWSSTWLPR